MAIIKNNNVYIKYIPNHDNESAYRIFNREYSYMSSLKTDLSRYIAENSDTINTALYEYSRYFPEYPSPVKEININGSNYWSLEVTPINGKSLEEYLADNKLPSPNNLYSKQKTSALLKQLYDALIILYYFGGMLYFDFNPKNIIITSENGKPHIKLIDFTNFYCLLEPDNNEFQIKFIDNSIAQIHSHIRRKNSICNYELLLKYSFLNLFTRLYYHGDADYKNNNSVAIDPSLQRYLCNQYYYNEELKHELNSYFSFISNKDYSIFELNTPPHTPVNFSNLYDFISLF